MSDRPVVVKLGGSLLGEQGLLRRFHFWLAAQPRSVVIAGGGAWVKTLRQSGTLEDDAAHWASVARMRENAARLAANYPRGLLVAAWEQVEVSWLRGQQPFLDVEPILRDDDVTPNHLPHTWDVSSDSIAARVAVLHDADLILIKSCPVNNAPYDWADLAHHGVVDAWFPNIAPGLAKITLANLPE